MAPTLGWLGSVGPDGQPTASVTVTLAAGQNAIVLSKVSNYAELDYVRLSYLPTPPAVSQAQAARAIGPSAAPKRAIPPVKITRRPTPVPIRSDLVLTLRRGRDPIRGV